MNLLKYFSSPARSATSFRLTHLWWWFFFISYEYSIVYFAQEKGHVLKYLFYYCINIVLFYTHTTLLNRTMGSSGWRYLKVAIWVLAELFGVLVIKLSLDVIIIGSFESIKGPNLQALAALNIYRSILFIGLASLYWAASNLSMFEKSARESAIRLLTAERDAISLENKLSHTENALLRQQINPHLLFNSLNFIHSSIYKVSEQAAENLILLTDILRFSMTEARPDGKIALEQEIEQLHNLIRINKARYERLADIDIAITGTTAGYLIIPLVLMTLTENVFKHGDMTEEAAAIRLNVSGNGELTFFTRNKVRAKAPYPRIKSTGLANIRVRLNYTYGDNYRLQVNEADGYFNAELILQL